MRLMITIDSENSGCRTRQDVCEILERLLPKIRLAGTESKHKILDINGQSVGHYSISADDEDEDEEESEDENEAPTSEPPESLGTKEEQYLTFTTDCENEGYKVREYRGRNFYVGPAVEVDTWDDVFKVGRCTKLEIQSDNLGKGYIVYPKVR